MVDGGRWEVYDVVERREDMEFVESVEHRAKRIRPVHRYNRVERFEFVLGQLLGLRGHVPEEIVEMCEEVDRDKRVVWDSVRGVLKANGKRKYYNRIPGIIWRLGKPRSGLRW